MPVSPSLLLSSQFVFNVGFYMVVPFLAIYLREDMLLAGSIVGLVLGLRTFSQQGLFVFGGALSDALGPRRMILLGCVVRVAGFLMLGIGGHLAIVLAGACLTGVGGALFSPAISSLMAKIGEISQGQGKRSRAQYFALLSVWGELGAVLGPMFAALLTGAGFRSMAFTGATIFVCAFVVLFFWLPRGEVTHMPRAKPAWAALFRDRLFLAFVLANSAQLFAYNQLYLSLPVEIARVGGTAQDLAPMFMIASVLVVSLQVPVTRLGQRLGSHVCIPLGFLVVGLAFATLAVFAVQPPLAAPFHLLPAALMVALLTLGSMLARPFVSDLVAGFAGARPSGMYFGAMASAGGMAVLVGNVALGPLLDKALVTSPAASLPWLVLAAIPAASAGGMLLLNTRLRARLAG
ncbi:MAG TPA: MFS transporter [Devosia sp.]|jgi:MFS family permease|uniref:MFS transporter n=1 Tax=Devosia sp. TaxID=1871048 RepID=UPI002F94ECA3